MEKISYDELLQLYTINNDKLLSILKNHLIIAYSKEDYDLEMEKVKDIYGVPNEMNKIIKGISVQKNDYNIFTYLDNSYETESYSIKFHLLKIHGTFPFKILFSIGYEESKIARDILQGNLNDSIKNIKILKWISETNTIKSTLLLECKNNTYNICMDITKK